jgi:RNA polymerase-binding transcription factor DksA
MKEMSAMDREDLMRYKEKLILLRRRLLEEINSLEGSIHTSQRDSSGDVSTFSMHMADLGTDAMEREKVSMLATSESQLYEDIEDAIQRLDGDTYGMCEMCGAPIRKDRLDALPFARFCLACQREAESDRDVRRSARGR